MTGGDWRGLRRDGAIRAGTSCQRATVISQGAGPACLLPSGRAVFSTWKERMGGNKVSAQDQEWAPGLGFQCLQLRQRRRFRRVRCWMLPVPLGPHPRAKNELFFQFL